MAFRERPIVQMPWIKPSRRLAKIGINRMPPSSIQPKRACLRNDSVGRKRAAEGETVLAASEIVVAAQVNGCAVDTAQEQCGSVVSS